MTILLLLQHVVPLSLNELNDCFYFSIVERLFENHEKIIKFSMHLLEEVTSCQTIFLSFCRDSPCVIKRRFPFPRMLLNFVFVWVWRENVIIKWKAVYCLRIRWFSILLMLIKPAHTLSINAIRSKYHPRDTVIFILFYFHADYSWAFLTFSQSFSTLIWSVAKLLNNNKTTKNRFNWWFSGMNINSSLAVL